MKKLLTTAAAAAAAVITTAVPFPTFLYKKVLQNLEAKLAQLLLLPMTIKGSFLPLQPHLLILKLGELLIPFEYYNH